MGVGGFAVVAIIHSIYGYPMAAVLSLKVEQSIDLAFRNTCITSAIHRISLKVYYSAASLSLLCQG